MAIEHASDKSNVRIQWCHGVIVLTDTPNLLKLDFMRCTGGGQNNELHMQKDIKEH